MNFLSFEYFMAIYEAGTVRKAAEELFISQQALSEHLNKLERELGAELLCRTNPMMLTRAGEYFVEAAQTCLRVKRTMEQKIEAEKTLIQNTVTVGVLSGYSPILLPEFLAFLRKEQPELSVSMVELPCRTGAIRDIPSHIDAVMGAFPSGNKLIHVPIIEDDHFVVAIHRKLLETVLGSRFEEVLALAFAGAAQELSVFSDCPFILKREGTVIRNNENRLFGRAGFRPKGYVETGDIELTMQLCQRAEAAVFLPEPIARATFFPNELSQKQSPILCCRVYTENDRWALSVAYPADAVLSAAMLRFISSAKTFYRPLLNAK